MSTRQQPPVAKKPPRGGGGTNQGPQDHACQYLDDLKAATAHIRRMEEERDRYKQEIASLQRELSATKSLAEGRGKQLSEAQDPMATNHGDRLSISDACETVHTLNKVILKASDSMAGSMIPHRYPEEQRNAAMPSVIECFGPNLPSMLIAESRRNTYGVNERLVYTILQLFLVDCCSSLLTHWCPGNRKESIILNEIYQGLRSTETQSVSGPWRALACSRIRIRRTPWQQLALTRFQDLLAVAGWKLASDADFQKFKDQLKLMFAAATKARTAIGEMVTSVDLAVAFFVGGTVNKQKTPRSEDEILAGTFFLGVDKITKERSTRVFHAQVIVDSDIYKGLQPQTQSGRETEPGAAHTATQKAGLGPLAKPTNYVDGAEQRATRNPFQG